MHIVVTLNRYRLLSTVQYRASIHRDHAVVSIDNIVTQSKHELLITWGASPAVQDWYFLMQLFRGRLRRVHLPRDCIKVKYHLLLLKHLCLSYLSQTALLWRSIALRRVLVIPTFCIWMISLCSTMMICSTRALDWVNFNVMSAASTFIRWHGVRGLSPLVKNLCMRWFAWETHWLVFLH